MVNNSLVFYCASPRANDLSGLGSTNEKARRNLCKGMVQRVQERRHTRAASLEKGLPEAETGRRIVLSLRSVENTVIR